MQYFFYFFEMASLPSSPLQSFIANPGPGPGRIKKPLQIIKREKYHQKRISKYQRPFKILGIPDEYTVTGSQTEILNHYGISEDGLVDIALKLIEQNRN